MPSGHSKTSSSSRDARHSGNSTSHHGYDYSTNSQAGKSARRQATHRSSSTNSGSSHYSDHDSHQARSLRKLSQIEEFMVTGTAEAAGTRERDAHNSMRQYEERMARAMQSNNNDYYHYTGTAGEVDDGRQRAYHRDDREFRYYEQYERYNLESSSRDGVNGSGATSGGSSNSDSSSHRRSHRSGGSHSSGSRHSRQH